MKNYEIATPRNEFGARNDRTLSKAILLLIVIFVSFLTPSFSFAQDFTATTVGDYGNVTVMEVTGNYNAINPDGTVNGEPREAIAKEFFRLHKDEYDFIVIFSNFDFQMPATEAEAFYLGVKNDTQGIGKPLFDYSDFFGSNGKLQGTIDMGNVSTLVTNPLNPKFEETLRLLSHEQMHRWGAYVKFKDANGNISTALLGKAEEHWSFLLDSYASVLYGNDWKDNGDGTFTSIAIQKYYSPLDLYLMGLNDKTQVPPMLLIDNPGIDPARNSEAGITIDGTPRYITIDDIIAAEGERIPLPSESQKTFKTAFILITAPGTFTGYELYGIENIRNGWVTRFSVLTDGKGIVQVVPAPIEEIPSSPGIPLPPYTPRTLPPKIEDGVQWLVNNQGADGSWTDLTQTKARDTAEAVFILKNFDISQQSYSLGLQWLNSNEPENTDYLSRKIDALMKTGQDISVILNELVSRQNPDGGWGSNKEYMSNPADTSFALKSFSAAGYSGQTVIAKAIEYLKSKQNNDGGWGSDDEGSKIEATANVLTAFSKYRNNYQIEDQITKGIAWLTQRQNMDGGFAHSASSGQVSSTVYDTALAIITLREFNVSSDITNNGINYILNLQSENGSWYDSPYQTALAIDAVWKATIDPDLSVKTEDITFIPSVITSLPTNLVMNVNIWNLGSTEVPQAKVVLYEGAIAEANKIGEQILAFPGQSSVTATFFVTIPDGNEHRFYVSVDPDNLVKESNETNNTALNIIKPESTYDFEILPSDVTVSRNPVDIFNDVKITSKITNKGTMNAYNVKVKYYIDEAGTPFDIAMTTVDIPANATISNEVTWHTNKAGDNLPITVQVDPFNSFTGISEENNQAVTYLTVNGATDPNLTISYQDIVITPSPVNELGSANISAVVKNEGFSQASNIQVNFYRGTPGVDGVLLGSRTISLLDAGGSSTVSMDWTNIMESGEKIIYVKVDPDNLVKEISEDDNDAFTTLKILSLPDLTISTNSIVFTPPAPKDGDAVLINVTVQNKGEQSASDVTVRAYEGNTIIGSQVIPSISGNSQASTSFTYDTTGKSGAHQITVIVDPDNVITEQSEDNNSALRTFGVQDANLWLTEQYISPNGDGIKDSTQFFFRLTTPQTVKIVVNSGKGRIVRAFSGSELENTTSGNITWDGLDDNGMVVDDGQYQIKIVDSNNNVIGSLLVVVDNNRSPLTDAIGTKYLLNNNLTCMLPDIYDEWEWLPNESGIVFRIDYPNPNTPEYPKGLYTMSPDGQDILKLLPSEWNGYYDVSPDGDKVAFTMGNKLWTVDIDGNNGTILDEVSEEYSIFDVKWSPDNRYILYNLGPVDVSSYSAYELWIINTESMEKKKIDWGYLTLELSAEWSPNSQEIAYFVLSSDRLNTDGQQVDELKVSDIMGNKRSIYTFDYCDCYTPIYWLDNKKIIALHSSLYSQLWLFDVSGNGDNKEMIGDYDFDYEFSISPDKKSLAFITSKDDTQYLNIADVSGNVYVPYEFGTTDPLCSPELYNIVWSPDSSKIAFIETISPCIDCSSPCSEEFEPHIIAINLEKKTKSVMSSASLILVRWLSDNISIVGQRYDENYRKEICVADIEKKSIITIASDLYLPYPEDKIVSPLERYITFNKNVESSSVCYGRGYQDLWALSSLLNLTADLNAIKEKSSVILKGIAADLNFEGYKLEYADTNTPDTWNLISPPSDMPVINDVFATWVPPYEGNFYVRLTIWDKAGNVVWDRKRISWGLSSSITNIYKSREIFSPNGDGVKDTVELHYRVLEPVHLEFTIYNANNSVIRTINKDYTSPADDYIAWDGRDGSGKIVPDGKYMIKIFDYEFFVEVDSTPPDVGILLTELMQDFDITANSGSSLIYTELEGHAVDANLKNWVVEYGEGDNPQEWYEYISGEDQLVGRDEDGNPVLEPIKDDTIETYFEDDIEWLVGKKLRITTEDFAGNKSTDVTDFLEEKLILHEHQWREQFEFFLLSMPQAIYPNLAIHRLHLLGGLETVRVPIVSMNVQYHSNGQWLDSTSVMNPTSGIINLEWDNSGLNQSVDAVRVKVVDILGHERYSNTVLIEAIERFGIDICNFVAFNSLDEDLKLLRIQIQSHQDVRYSQWTDYRVFDSSKGDTIPVGSFDIYPKIGEIKEGLIYQFKMVGVGVSGNIYETDIYTYPNPDCSPITLKFSLSVNYNEADCGLLSDGKATLSAKIEGLAGNVSLKTLSYYIQKPEGLQFLRQFDLIL
jgi:subtilase family serine protease